MINKIGKYNLSIKINGFDKLGEYTNSIPIFSRNVLCDGIDSLMIKLISYKEQFYLQTKLNNKKCKNKILEIIDFYPHYIEIRRDGIYRITQKRGHSHQIFEGEFQFLGFKRENDENVFIIMINESVYMGTFQELMN